MLNDETHETVQHDGYGGTTLVPADDSGKQVLQIVLDKRAAASA